MHYFGRQKYASNAPGSIRPPTVAKIWTTDCVSKGLLLPVELIAAIKELPSQKITPIPTPKAMSTIPKSRPSDRIFTPNV